MTYLMRMLHGHLVASRPDDGAGTGGGSEGSQGDPGDGGTWSGGQQEQQQGQKDSGNGGGDDRKLTSENRSLRQRLKEAEAERDKLRSAQQTEQEKLADRATKAEQSTAALSGRIQTLELERVIGSVRSDLGIVASPSTCARLLDRDGIEWDDDHRPTEASVKAALKALAKSDPALVRQGPGDTGGGRNGGGKGGDDMNALIRGAAGR